MKESKLCESRTLKLNFEFLTISNHFEFEIELFNQDTDLKKSC